MASPDRGLPDRGLRGVSGRSFQLGRLPQGSRSGPTAVGQPERAYRSGPIAVGLSLWAEAQGKLLPGPLPLSQRRDAQAQKAHRLARRMGPP